MEFQEIKKLLDSLSYDSQKILGLSLIHFIIGYASNSERDNISFESIFEFISETTESLK